MSEKIDKDLERKVEKIIEKKSKNGSVVFLTVLLVLIVLLFVGYVLVDQRIIVFNDKTQVEEEVKKIEVNINESWVQSLYEKVSGDGETANAFHYWRYLPNNSNGIVTSLDNFNVKTASEVVKMQLVAKNLSENDLIFYGTCFDLNVPETNSIGAKSACALQKEYDITEAMSYYKKSAVERVYKDLFGEDSELDTSVTMRMDYFGGMSYTYVAQYDGYYLYKIITGGVVGPGGYIGKLTSAVKEGKTLRLTETVTEEIYEGDVRKEDKTFILVYTFEQEEDGSYKYISREKI